MAEDWRIMEEVEMIVHDNAANMMGVYNISDFPPHCTAGRCINHLLQLVIKDCIFTKPNVSRIIQSCRNICKKVHVSPNFYTDLERLQRVNI